MLTLMISELTLKQTQSEKGSVARTMAQDMAVRIQPHRPIPSSVSSAETKKRRFSYSFQFSSAFCIRVTGYDIMSDQTLSAGH